MTAMLSATGVYNAALYANPLVTVILGALTLLFTFMVANVSAMKIKNISVYELLTE